MQRHFDMGLVRGLSFGLHEIGLSEFRVLRETQKELPTNPNAKPQRRPQTLTPKPETPKHKPLIHEPHEA